MKQDNSRQFFIPIIIPVLNEEKIIAATLAKLKQPWSIPHEIIVSDGGSTDKTVALSRGLADKVVVFNGIGGAGKDSRQTIAQGRNEGAKIAGRGPQSVVGGGSGDHVAGSASIDDHNFLVFFDADCTIPNPDDFFSKALLHFEDPNTVALTVRLKVLPEYETLADRVIFGIMNWVLALKNNVFKYGESPGEFQMIRRSAFERLGGFREDLVTREDADMFLRLSKIGRTVFDGKLTVFHTGRRAHAVGWPRLLLTWGVNIVYFSLFDKAASKEWKVIR